MKPVLTLPNAWGGSTTLNASRSVPTAYVNSTVLLHHVSQRFDYLNQLLQKYTGKSWSEVAGIFWDVVFIAVLVSIPAVYFQAYRRKQWLAQEKQVEIEFRTRMGRLWETKSWPTLFGLFDLYLLRKLPHGPEGYDEDKTLRDWGDKRFLRRLVHMGIIPLYIQDGGVDTRQIQHLEISDDFPFKPTLPNYVQGKRRAYFEFLVPQAKGYSRWNPGYGRQDRPAKNHYFFGFMDRLLNNHHEYRVSVSSELGDRHGLAPPGEDVDCSPAPPSATHPFEIGADSCFEPLLPFKPDKVIQQGKGLEVQQLEDFFEFGACPLLGWKNVPLVRVEVPHYGHRKLDEWVYGIAQEAGMGPIWKKGTLHTYASAWLKRKEFQLPEGAIPTEDRLQSRSKESWVPNP